MRFGRGCYAGGVPSPEAGKRRRNLPEIHCRGIWVSVGDIEVVYLTPSREAAEDSTPATPAAIHADHRRSIQVGAAEPLTALPGKINRLQKF